MLIASKSNMLREYTIQNLLNDINTYTYYKGVSNQISALKVDTLHNIIIAGDFSGYIYIWLPEHSRKSLKFKLHKSEIKTMDICTTNMLIFSVDFNDELLTFSYSNFRVLSRRYIHKINKIIVIDHK